MVKLTDLDFDLKYKKLKKINNKISILFIYADWCIHCQRFKPIFNKSKNILKNINFYKADSQDEKNIGIMKSFKILGFPTILLFEKNGKFVGQYQGSRDTVDSFTKELLKFSKSII